VIAVNHISDTEDDSMRKSLQGLRIIAVSKDTMPTQYYKPTAENIRNGNYPFLRNIYMINGEGTNGLATGFAAFVLSDIGMTIIEQIGLKPAKEPVRVIEIRKSFE
jgi:phosphate transport system substrate-binding protein